MLSILPYLVVPAHGLITRSPSFEGAAARLNDCTGR